MDQYYIVEASIISNLEEQICSVAREKYDCAGIEEFSLDEPRVDEILGERSYSGADIPVSVIQEVEQTTKGHKALLKFYFNNQERAQSFSKDLNENYKIDSDMSAYDNQDWNQEWRKSFQTIEVSKSLKIIPAWEKKENESNNSQLYIYPGQGFGTGNHETTYLCLKLYSELVDLGAKFNNCLDFGCGSGILGLAYARDFEGPVDLYDIDQAALDNCHQNIEINELKSQKINTLLPAQRKVIEWQSYSLIFANILQNVLLDEAEFLTSHLTDDGFLILSGLLEGQENEVIAKYQTLNNNLHAAAIQKKGDWVAILMELR